jgi:Mg-chelatase subunit ChlD
MKGKLTFLLVMMCAFLAGPAGAQAGGAPDLVRCAGDRTAPCLRMRFGISEAAASGDAKHWSGAVGTIAFREVDARTVTKRHLVLLVLCDVSGSMAGKGIEQARSALRAFLRTLDGSVTQVAVAPFGSHGVVSGIRAVRFGTPSEAEAQVDRLPVPAGNTGLYSAVQAGAELLAARLRAAPAGAQGALLVLTDGRNDVGPSDERGLLVGTEGRERALDALRRSRVPVWMVGIGSGVDAAELARLAGPHGTAHVVDFEPVRLGRTLAEFRGTLATTREVTAVLPASSRARLARGEAMVRVEHGASAWSRDLRWRPPLIALPAFTGVASPSRQLVTVQDEPVATARLALAFFGTLLALLWFVVPALLWPVRRTPRVAVRGRRSRGGVRPNVQEAPPRRPNEITASVVRRVVVGS